MTGSRSESPNRGRGAAATRVSAISTTCSWEPPSTPPVSSTMSGRRWRSRWMRSWSSRPSSAEMASITMAPALNAARSADSALICRTTPATVICSPPPAELVER